MSFKSGLCWVWLTPCDRHTHAIQTPWNHANRTINVITSITGFILYGFMWWWMYIVQCEYYESGRKTLSLLKYDCMVHVAIANVVAINHRAAKIWIYRYVQAVFPFLNSKYTYSISAQAQFIPHSLSTLIIYWFFFCFFISFCPSSVLWSMFSLL